MKSSSSSSQQPRRSSFVFATTTAAALLMAGAPNQAHARNLRRSSSSSSNIAANLIVEDEVGFEVTSSNNDAGVEAVGSPFFHDVVTNNRDEEFDRSRHHRQLEAHDHEPKEYINDETLEFVSAMFVCIFDRDHILCSSLIFNPFLAYLYCTHQISFHCLLYKTTSL